MRPANVLTLSDLVERTGFPERTIRNYVKHKVLPRVDPAVGERGFGELHVLLLMAIGFLHKQHIRRHADLRARLQGLSPEQLEALLAEELRDRVLVEDPTEPAGPPVVEPATGTMPVATPESPPREEWERVVLAPGLEVQAKRDAAPEVRRLAEAILVLAARGQGST
jgi:hypothetical protein